MLITLKRNQWAILFACLSMFVLGMADNIRGPLFPELMNYFKLTNSEGSSTFAATSAAAFIGNMVSVLLLKKLTSSKLLILTVLLMGVGLFMMGAVPTFTLYIFSAVIFGFSLGIMGVVQNLIVTENISLAKQPKSLSGLHGIYGLSSLLAPLIASRSPELINSLGFSSEFSWRSAFFITAIIALIVFLFSLLTKSDPKFEVHKQDEHQIKDNSSLFVLLIFGGIFAFYVVAEILVSTRLALYMRTYFNMNLEQSSNYVTYFFIFLLLGRLIFALKTFSISLKSQLNFSLLLSLACLILGLWMHPIFLTAVGLTMAPFYPISVAYISNQTGIHKRKFITFAMSFQSFCVISMHLGVGFLTDKFGLFYAFGVGIVSLVLSLICVNFHPKVSTNS